ncbi:CAAX amino protease [Streptococcus sanguinis SK1 = NCTC 7863]|jgi:hypothetical protein|nr:CPBP family intramembrane glutamic endopeptidase [Streptococcus sanguinis]EGC24078.1 CAAX amino terminal protease family protein [Streptococcus sanguinis SK405]EGF05819.1 CAAX amino protease [Streptococcus sanguinis SK1 = NCTC 7863]EGF22453.1 CAAX amino protease [Streptococcus sanguinis SK1058]MBZ2076002.1 CPBP family intramembrane metalloprotease [Streptococcus sanguinis]MCY7014397.1 CPBP family intramembrane metalloprotease [Streptococcus sanguinis]
MQARNYKDSSSVKQILMFLLWTFGISWSAWLASAFLRIPIISQVLTIAGVFGPAIGAKLVLGKSFKELLASIGSARKRTWVHLLILTILYTLSIVFWSPLLPGFSPLRIALLFLMTTLLTGGNEEIGWQGFLQPSLEKILPFPLATVTTGLIWAVWHLPLFFTAACLLARFWLAALYKVSQSILYCVLFHGAINTIGEGIFLGKGTENPLFFLGYILMAAYSIYLWYQRDQQDKA